MLKKLILNLPYFGNKIRLLETCKHEPGSYYSPIPNLEEIRKRKDVIFRKEGVDLKGIEINKAEQFSLLENFKNYYNNIPYDFINASPSDTRYQVKGAWYRNSDVVMLYSMMRHFKPKRIIEVGSGYSSAVMLDINDMFLHSQTTMSFIDPHPERLFGLMNENDKKQHHVLSKIVQEVDIEVFKSLEANDILFIDSSHVSKVGSDLNHLLFEILPVLKPGVLIHFHDIYYPFEMPEHWVLEWRWCWNENYLLRAFLTGNKNYKIINFNSYLHSEYQDWFSKNMPACLIDIENTGCIWLTKC
jgi:predicted O-methyltransferase YrrM